MKRLRLLLILFSIALAVPLVYFVVRTHHSLAREEVAELRYFSETLFDRMEDELADLVRREEARSVDEYSYFMLRPGQAPGRTPGKRSPLSYPPDEPYILGYFQNSPDGSLQTPLLADPADISAEHADAIRTLREINSVLNRKRTQVSEGRGQVSATAPEPEVADWKDGGLIERYFSRSRSAKQKTALGQEKKRHEEITLAQAEKIVDYDMAAPPAKEEMAATGGWVRDTVASLEGGASISSTESAPAKEADGGMKGGDSIVDILAKTSPETFRVEVAPLQALLIDDQYLFLFRRVVVNERIYRQGFAVKVGALLDHLVAGHFQGEPLSEFSGLVMTVFDRSREAARVEAGITAADPEFSLSRRFPRPFSFLTATLSCARIPPSPGRGTLWIMTIACATIILLGLAAIYQSARMIVDLAERRAGFVSSVTHELKTPLTNIRMYIEMLEQGIAANPERKREYFRVLLSESSRLSRLINNVLEFSRLERKQRPLDLQEGRLTEVIDEVREGMAEKLLQEGFVFEVTGDEISPFRYDREAMVQILINLLDNSIKFGREASEKKISLHLFQSPESVILECSDTGPGISRQAVDKIFNDFYREDNSLTRRTQGTGIGLALVKKLVSAMGGSVRASNNPGRGCTITITLPRSRSQKTDD